jgi:hypothetical protein
MLQRSTWILVAVALGLGAVVLVGEGVRQSTSETQETAGDPLLAADESEVTTFTVRRQGETLSFELTDGEWMMTAPEAEAAEPGAIAFLLNSITQDDILRRLTLAPGEEADFGFDNPPGEVDITLADGSQHTLLLGDVAPGNTAVYVLWDAPELPLDPEDEPISLYLAHPNLVNAINRPLAEWQLAAAEAAAEEAEEDEPDAEAEPNGSSLELVDPSQELEEDFDLDFPSEDAP